MCVCVEFVFFFETRIISTRKCRTTQTLCYGCYGPILKDGLVNVESVYVYTKTIKIKIPNSRSKISSSLVFCGRRED